MISFVAVVMEQDRRGKAVHGYTSITAKVELGTVTDEERAPQIEILTKRTAEKTIQRNIKKIIN